MRKYKRRCKKHAVPAFEAIDARATAEKVDVRTAAFAIAIERIGEAMK